MYKKKNQTPVIIAVVVLVVLFAAMFALRYFTSSRRSNNAETEIETETETEIVTEGETETPKHNILLYNNSSGTVDYDSGWLLSGGTLDDEDVVLSVEEDTLVTLMITPNEGKEVYSVDVLDYNMHEISSVLRSASGVEGDYTGEMRLSFVMPNCDIFVNFNYADIPEDETDEVVPDDQEEAENYTYGLILHNLTSDVITSFNGQFDEEKFLHDLGEALHVDSSRSEYRTVTDVYFGDLVENNTEKLSYEIYFNNDTLWNVLATYYPSEDAYVFTEIEAEEANGEEVVDEEAVDADTGNVIGTYEGTTTSSGAEAVSDALASGGTISSGSSGATSSSGTGASSETTTSFNIMSVSTVFLKFVGDEDAFYQAAFDYVIGNGLTGDIVGTMSDYVIDPEKQTATIRIMLNTGATITGKYNKNKNTYSFSGL